VYFGRIVVPKSYASPPVVEEGKNGDDEDDAMAVTNARVADIIGQTLHVLGFHHSVFCYWGFYDAGNWVNYNNFMPLL
jgi:hypothetical protein